MKKAEEVTYDINRPWLSLDDWQKEYIFGTKPEENCFLLTGRQCGKTTAMSIKAVELAVKHHKKGEHVMILSITEKQGYHMLAKALTYATQKYPGKTILHGKNKPTKHRISFTTGVDILCYAAGEDGAGVRGHTIKKLMIDEGSRMSEEFFVAVQPMLSVVNGSMDIASTPFGKQGFFYKCSINDKFRKFYISSEDSPRHSKEFLEEQKERMSELQYAQEYRGEFLDNLKRFFPDKLIRERMTLRRRDFIEEGKKYYLGTDVARFGRDENTFEIIDASNSKHLKHIENKIIKKIRTTEHAREIWRLNSIYNFKQIFIDDGGMGVGPFDMLLDDMRTSRKTIALNNEARALDKNEKRRKRVSVADLYNNLLALMENKRIELLDDEELYLSLSSIQAEYRGDKLEIIGNYKHIADGLVRAAWCSKDKTLNIYVNY